MQSIFPGNPAALSGRRVTLMGLGTFGGGVAAARYLIDCGASLTITDTASQEKMSEALEQLCGDLDRPLERLTLGGHVEGDFREAELLVVNPAVRPDNQWLKFARENSIPVTTELGLLWNELRSNKVKIAAITGSNGKSTTSALLQSILKEHFGTAHLGGNLGGSLLPHLSEIRCGEWVVLEVSSFQLHYLQSLPLATDIAVVTNFSPNHLDWHKTLNHYRGCKQVLLQNQDDAGIAVLNADDPNSRDWITKGKRSFFGLTEDGRLLVNEKPIDWPVLEWTGLKGHHHLANIAAAMTAAEALNIPLEAMEQGLRQYKPLPHRLQWIGEHAGRNFYNDSLATTPESAMAALQAFDEPIVLLAGGSDKGSDLRPFAGAMFERCKQIVLMGETAGQLTDYLTQQQEAELQTWSIAKCFDEAMQQAWRVSEPGDIILLSPGCASYGWFRDFRERGERFVEYYHKLAIEDPSN
ncbi:MAG: UDP-N-acetylmuramoyl-L-alanine--D-glutamate ligase [Planctomycetaceae bacterium]|nr:UDP-N-acetylmuramoyl-L-alanine--D-glutamate ligase [Planctomycetaceae bacterium]